MLPTARAPQGEACREVLVTRTVLLSLLVALAVSRPATADVVRFLNGDQLQGTVGRLTDGRLEIRDTVAGTIQVDMIEVATLSTDGAAELIMHDGSIVMQPVEDAEPGFVHVAALAPGGALALSEIREINPPYVPSVRYGGSIVGALEVDRGNKHETDMDVELVLKRETDMTLIRFLAEYEGERTKDSSTGDSFTRERSYEFGLRINRSLERYGPVYAYINNEWEKNFSKALDPRVRIGSGLGYRWLNSDTAKFSTEVGLAWVKKDYSDESDDEQYLAGRMGWVLERQLSPKLDFFQNGTWTPSLDDNDDHIIEVDAGLRYFLTRAIFTEAKVEWDYDSLPADDTERQDVLYKFGVGYEF